MYSIEVPMYAETVAQMTAVSQRPHVQLVAYGGYPDSPLNGGRYNFAMDDFQKGAPTGSLVNSALGFLNPKANRGGPFAAMVEKARVAFVERTTALNQAGIPFLLTFTNTLIQESELEDENLEPVALVAELGRRFGLKNGIILHSPVLDAHLRAYYDDALHYVSSCTKYFVRDRHLKPRETQTMIEADLQRFDRVVLTPQLSRNEGIMRALAAQASDKVVAICNSYCADSCNSFGHYDVISRGNKRSLASYGIADVFEVVSEFNSQYSSCPAQLKMMGDLQVPQRVKTQLDCGMRHFKLGRGYGSELLLQLASVLDHHAAGAGAIT